MSGNTDNGFNDLVNMRSASLGDGLEVYQDLDRLLRDITREDHFALEIERDASRDVEHITDFHCL